LFTKSLMLYVSSDTIFCIKEDQQCTHPKMWSRASSFWIPRPGLPMITTSSENWQKQVQNAHLEDTLRST
jgi:hypothetical protein